LAAARLRWWKSGIWKAKDHCSIRNRDWSSCAVRLADSAALATTATGFHKAKWGTNWRGQWNWDVQRAGVTTPTSPRDMPLSLMLSLNLPAERTPRKQSEMALATRNEEISLCICGPRLIWEYRMQVAELFRRSAETVSS